MRGLLALARSVVLALLCTAPASAASPLVGNGRARPIGTIRRRGSIGSWRSREDDALHLDVVFAQADLRRR
jgi:hypothetical protein